MSAASLTLKCSHLASPKIEIKKCLSACLQWTAHEYAACTLIGNSQSSLRGTVPWVQGEQEHAPGAWFECALDLYLDSPPRASAAA